MNIARHKTFIKTFLFASCISWLFISCIDLYIHDGIRTFYYSSVLLSLSFGFILTYFVLKLKTTSVKLVFVRHPYAINSNSKFFCTLSHVLLNKYSILLLAVFILLCWLPFLVAMYPAGMNWDTTYQLSQFHHIGEVYLVPWGPSHSFVTNAFSDHHPIFDTFIYGIFTMIGTENNWNIGIFSFIIFQSICTALTFSYSIVFLNQKNVNSKLLLSLLIVYAFYPVYPAYSGIMVKDSLNAWIALLWLIEGVHIFENNNYKATSSARKIFFVLLTILNALTRKLSMYFMILLFIYLVIKNRTYWKFILITTMSLLFVMNVIMPMFIFPTFDIISGGKQEMLQPLFQQTTKYYLTFKDEIPEDEIAAIDKVLDVNTLDERYDPFITDYVKNMWNYKASSEDIKNYLKVWLKEGLRHPLNYIDTTLTIASQFFTDTPLNILWNTGDTDMHGLEQITKPQIIKNYQSKFIKFYDLLTHLPIIGFIFTYSFFTIFLPLCIYILKLQRNIQCDFITGFLVLNLVLFTAFPSADARYILILAYTEFFIFAYYTKYNRSDAKPLTKQED